MIKERVLQQGGYQSRWIAVGVVVSGKYILDKEKKNFYSGHIVGVGVKSYKISII